MITGAIKSQIGQIWNAFWSGGISNPIEVIEQITYLLFVRRLDDLHTLEENKSARVKKPIARRVFPEGKDGIGKRGGRPNIAKKRRGPKTAPAFLPPDRRSLGEGGSHKFDSSSRAASRGFTRSLTSSRSWRTCSTNRCAP